jgi:hypothetical protein
MCGRDDGTVGTRRPSHQHTARVLEYGAVRPEHAEITEYQLVATADGGPAEWIDDRAASRWSCVVPAEVRCVEFGAVRGEAWRDACLLGPNGVLNQEVGRRRRRRSVRCRSGSRMRLVGRRRTAASATGEARQHHSRDLGQIVLEHVQLTMECGFDCRREESGHAVPTREGDDADVFGDCGVPRSSGRRGAIDGGRASPERVGSARVALALVTCLRLPVA